MTTRSEFTLEFESCHFERNRVKSRNLLIINNILYHRDLSITVEMTTCSTIYWNKRDDTKFVISTAAKRNGEISQQKKTIKV